MASPSDKDAIQAAGVVLLRMAGGRKQICILHRPTHKDWSLPKGKIDPGEHVITAARRETIEETGRDVVFGVPLMTQRYRVEGRPKTVRYWVGHVRSGGPGFRPNKEIDELDWVSPKQAARRLTYPRDVALVRSALREPTTSPLIILRHAQAIRRASWGKKPDERRPLTNAGVRDAEVLSTILRAFGIDRIFTSDAVRCVDTVAAYADDFKLNVNTERIFSEEAFEHNKRAARQRITKLLRDPRPTVVCTHRPVLPGLMRQIGKSTSLPPRLPRLSPDLPPGGFVVLHRDFHPKHGMQVVAIERHCM